MSYHYHIGGLSVVSDIAMPGARHVAAEASPDVTIRRGAVPERLESPTIAQKSWWADDRQLLARVPKARFLVSDGRSIVYQPEAGVAPTDITAYLGGSVFGFLMHQRGGIVLHASALSIAGRAVLFCGPSGMGKSTVAAALCQRDHELLADDFCVVNLDRGDRPAVEADARMHRLTDASLAALKPSGIGPRVASHAHKYYVEPATPVALGRVPIGDIFVLERAREPAIEDFNAAEAARALFRNAYRPTALRRMGQVGLYLDAIAVMLRYGRVRRLALPDNLESLDAAIALIERGVGEGASDPPALGKQAI